MLHLTSAPDLLQDESAEATDTASPSFFHASRTTTVVLSTCCKEGSGAIKLRCAEVQATRRSASIT